MEVRSRKRYSKEFRQDVLNMLKTGNKKVSELSRDLGISEPIIYRWYKAVSGNTVQEEKLSEQEKELRELRSKLADVTEERDILKKAVSIFSKQGNLK
jgi:transposase